MGSKISVIALRNEGHCTTPFLHFYPFTFFVKKCKKGVKKMYRVVQSGTV